jgi:hypothetical protein
LVRLDGRFLFDASETQSLTQINTPSLHPPSFRRNEASFRAPRLTGAALLIGLSCPDFSRGAKSVPRGNWGEAGA